MTTRVAAISGRIINVEACGEPPRHFDCPCCKGTGAHWNRPGNDPDRELYPCQTCKEDGGFECEGSEGSYELYKVAAHNIAIKKVDYSFPGDDEDETRATVSLEIIVDNIEVAERLRSLAGTGPYGLGIWTEAERWHSIQP